MKYSIVDHLVRAAIFGSVPQKLGDLGEIVGKGGDGDQQVEDHGELPERSSDANVTVANGRCCYLGDVFNFYFVPFVS